MNGLQLELNNRWTGECFTVGQIIVMVMKKKMLHGNESREQCKKKFMLYCYFKKL